MDITNIYIPQKIHVGYQNRDDTYTGKLAYVIYTDNKGKKHKEVSFDNWRDKLIPVDDFDNEPINGFVLNRKAGGVEDSWGHYARLSYVRVYDPRGFEFEISIQNLLWILQECNSTKGKGIDGELIYGWDGKDLVLVPTCSVDYKQICDNTKYADVNTGIKPSDVVVGYTYEQKNGNKYVYLGRYDYYKIFRKYSHHIGFVYIDKLTRLIDYRYEIDKKYYWYADLYYKTIYIRATKTPKKFYRCVEESVNSRYNEMVDAMTHSEDYSPINYNDIKKMELPFENFCMAFANNKTKNAIRVYSEVNTHIFLISIFHTTNYEISVSTVDDITNMNYNSYYKNEDYYTDGSVDLVKLYNKIKPVYFIYKQINGNEFKRVGWYDKDGNQK